jgi:hypothetical protein
LWDKFSLAGLAAEKSAAGKDFDQTEEHVPSHHVK